MLKKLISSLILLIFCSSAWAINFPNKPAQNNFYVDDAKLISFKDGLAINEIGNKLWQSQKVPLVIVTIPSLAAEGASDTTIEGYSRALFSYWQLGSKERNYGMLLLVSRDDRKARIELGDAWGREHDAQATQIMSNNIIPNFKKGQYSLGILEGAKGLDSIARGLNLPAPTHANNVANQNNSLVTNPEAAPSPMSNILSLLAIIAIVALIISLFRSGRTGWGWASIALLGGLVWYLFNNRNNDGGGSSGGNDGIFGGGSSGGGGSTGSW